MKVFAAALIAMCAIGVSVQAGDDSAKDPKDAKETAKVNFELMDLDGKKVELASFKDKFVVLEWHNPHCPYVVAHGEKGTYKSLAAMCKENGAVYMGVMTGVKTTADNCREFQKKYGTDYPIVLDPTGKVGRLFNAKTTPHMFIVKNGEILYQGAIDSKKEDGGKTNYVTKAMKELLAGKPVSTPKTKPYGCSVKFPKAMAAN